MSDRPKSFITGGLIDSGKHVLEDRHNVIWAKGPAREDRKVQVLREAIGLDVALLQTRTALESPRYTQPWIRSYAPEHPTNDIVFFYNVLAKLPLPDPFI